MKNPFRSIMEKLRPKNELTPMQLEELVRRMNSTMQADSGVSVNVQNAAGVAAVSSSVRYLSDTIAHLPLQLFRRTGPNSQELARELPLYRVLATKPNRHQTSYQWRKLGMRDLLLRGNWYNLVEPLTRGSFELIRLHPDSVEKKQDRMTGEITFLHATTNGPKTYTSEQVLHFWFDSDDGITGLNPIQVHRNSIGDAISIREHGSFFFRNAARMLGILEQDASISIDDDSLKDLLEDFNSMYRGGPNAHKTAALPKGFKFNQVSMSMEDSQWIEARKTTAREIFGIFGVPPHKGGDLADATYSNVEQENISAVIDAVAPRLVALEQTLNEGLLMASSGELFVKFNMSGLLRGDFKSRQQGLNIQRRAGVINADEWRAFEDKNPRGDGGGEEYIVERNMRTQDGLDESTIADMIDEAIRNASLGSRR